MSIESCPGFLFDLEYFLIAEQNNLKMTELPVHLYLNSRKSTVRLFRESIETLKWLINYFFEK